VGVFFALLLAALIPPRHERPQTVSEAREQVKTEMAVEAGVSVFFWILVVAAIIGILVYYL
jgi:hypothetical protein